MSMSLEDATMTIQAELASGESIAWMGQPNPSVVFHKQDLFLIPFSLLWGGFAIFWEGSVAGFWNQGSRNEAWIFGMIWGIPFVLIGQYLIWGRFVHDSWLKGRTYYAVTNRRVIVVQKGWSKRIASAYLDSLPAITKEGSDAGPGTLSFVPDTSFFSGFAGGTSSSGRRNNWGAWNSMSIGSTPVFRDIDNLGYVYRLVSDLREKARSSKP